MNRSILFTFFAVGLLLSSSGCRTTPIPTQLVGEWATPDSKFQNNALSDGEALYISADGIIVMIAGPPPIGTQGKVKYSNSSHELTVHVKANPDEGLNVPIKAKLVYDPEHRTIRGDIGKDENSVFTRRRDSVPSGIIEPE